MYSFALPGARWWRALRYRVRVFNRSVSHTHALVEGHQLLS
jgi:hypothetical protein